MIRRLAPLAAAVAIAATPVVAQGPVQGNVVTSSASTPITGAGAGGYIGSATISNPSLFGTGPFAIFCTDQNNNITLGTTLTNAWITPLFGTIDLANTRLGGDSNGSLPGVQPIVPNALAIYKANAFLASQLQGASASQRATLQSQIWDNAEAPYSATLFGNPNFDATGWYVVTMPNAVGNDAIGPQELLAFRPVPEPSTYALMATGLGMVALVARRRRVA